MSVNITTVVSVVLVYGIKLVAAGHPRLKMLRSHCEYREVFHFYPRDAMLARVIEIATCLSVRLAVRHVPVLCQNEES